MRSTAAPTWVDRPSSHEYHSLPHRQAADQLVQVVAEHSTLPAATHCGCRARGWFVEPVFPALYRPDSALYLCSLGDQLLFHLVGDEPAGLPARGDADLLHAKLLHRLHGRIAPSAAIVGVGAGCLSDARDMILHRAHRELRVVQLALVGRYRREQEATAKSGDSPAQPELDGLAHLAADDRVKLGQV